DHCPLAYDPEQKDLNGNKKEDACELQSKPDNRGCYIASDTVSPPDGTEPTFDFTDIADTGTQLPIFNQSVSDPLPLGFDLDVYGKSFSHVRVSSNGFLQFDGLPYVGDNAQDFPSTSNPGTRIGALWTGLFVESGSVLYQTLGTAPDRRFIVEFRNIDLRNDNKVT